MFESIWPRVQPFTLLDEGRGYSIYYHALKSVKLDGEIIECGVYKGGSAMILANILPPGKSMYLLDTFEGMPETDAIRDNEHKKGDFKDTSLEEVADRVISVNRSPDIFFKKGFIPETFAGMEHMNFCFAHIDLDIYRSYIDSLNFLYPRMTRGGIIIFDDYGFGSCLGSKLAVDEFLADKVENVESTGSSSYMIIKK